MKTCKTCGQEKTLDQFHKDRSKADGLNAYCKPCTIERQRRFLARPPRRKDPEGMKTCCRCKTLKPLSEYANHRRTFDGKMKRCNACCAELHTIWRTKNLDYVAIDARRRRAENPERYADYSRKKNYGLEPGAFAGMLAAQGGRCAICQTDKPGGRTNTFHVDHCHDMGHVRGLLCNRCNTGLGHFLHDVNVLSSAIRYLAERGGVGGD